MGREASASRSLSTQSASETVTSLRSAPGPQCAALAISGAFDSVQFLSFRILDQLVEVRCESASIALVVVANFEAMAVDGGTEPADLHYVLTDAESGACSVARRGQPPTTVADLGELLFWLEKDVTIALQLRQPELLFLHAAALEIGGRAWLLAGDSGNGKSTTTWGLLHHGFRYLSDELSAVDLETWQVHPYPHALCMKRRPPARYPLPADVLDLGDTIHVPVRSLPALVFAQPCTAAAVLLVHYRADLDAPSLRLMSQAEAGARLYAVTLNALAHPGHGLDAAIQLAGRVPCYELESADLLATCELVGRLVAAPQLGTGQSTAARM